MRLRLLLTAAAALVGSLAGCRFEEATPTVAEAPPDSAGLRTEGPPVVAGDTALVTPDEAARPDPPVTASPDVAPSGLAIPVLGVEADDLVDTFKQARSEGRVHNAIDILAPRGTPVVAAADGEVARLFTSDRGGLTVYQIAPGPGDGWTVYYYAHLDAYAPGLEAGQRLRRGQTVGTVGDSGNAVPGNTHLHFAVWRVADRADFWDGEPVNPYGLLGGR